MIYNCKHIQNAANSEHFYFLVRKGLIRDKINMKERQCVVFKARDQMSVIITRVGRQEPPAFR